MLFRHAVRPVARLLATTLSAGALLAISGITPALFAQGAPGGRNDGPPPMKNLQVFPANTPRPEVINTMRSFTRALNVDCEFCHVEEGEGANHKEDFASDAKPEKLKARAMMKMTMKINSDLLPAIPKRESPPIDVTCMTCHHGSAEPATLASHLNEVLSEAGIDSAKAEYRALREDAEYGRFDVSEQAVNEWARALSGTGKTAEALSVLEMNLELHPGSPYVQMTQADVYAARGEKDAAIGILKKLIAADPENERLARRLKDLESGGTK